MTTLNEARYGSGKEVVKKTWAERLAETPEVESDVDEQLLMNVPYVSSFFLPSLLTLPFTVHLGRLRLGYGDGWGMWLVGLWETVGVSTSLTRQKIHRPGQAALDLAAHVRLGLGAQDAESHHQPRGRRLWRRRGDGRHADV